MLGEELFIVLTPASLRARNPHGVLASEPFIRLDRAAWTGRMVDRYLRHTGIRPHERLELDVLEAVAVMVDRGLGVSLVPDWAPPWPEGLSIRKMPLPGRGHDAPHRRHLDKSISSASIGTRLSRRGVHRAQSDQTQAPDSVRTAPQSMSLVGPSRRFHNSAQVRC
jgi:DNA-binding transcriptional LysR family regulator